MKRCGFTLVELIISLTTLAILGGVLVSMYLAGTRLFGTELGSAAVRGNVNTALLRMGKTLREARLVDQITPVSVTVWEDFNTNGTRDANETVGFLWSGTAGDPLYKIVDGGPPGLFLLSVQNFSIAYTPAIKTFQVSLQGEVGGVTRTLMSQVQARNL